MKKVPKSGRDDPVEDDIFTEYEYNITKEGASVEDDLSEEEGQGGEDKGEDK